MPYPSGEREGRGRVVSSIEVTYITADIKADEKIGEAHIFFIKNISVRNFCKFRYKL